MEYQTPAQMALNQLNAAINPRLLVDAVDRAAASLDIERPEIGRRISLTPYQDAYQPVSTPIIAMEPVRRIIPDSVDKMKDIRADVRSFPIKNDEDYHYSIKIPRKRFAWEKED